MPSPSSLVPLPQTMWMVELWTPISLPFATCEGCIRPEAGISHCALGRAPALRSPRSSLDQSKRARAVFFPSVGSGTTWDLRGVHGAAAAVDLYRWRDALFDGPFG
jgi:hypothetical protein